MSEANEYRVEPDGDRFVVRDGTDRAVCIVDDRQQAEHYAVLLEGAFVRGRKFGYRLAKRGEPLPE